MEDGPENGGSDLSLINGEFYVSSWKIETFLPFFKIKKCKQATQRMTKRHVIRGRL